MNWNLQQDCTPPVKATFFKKVTFQIIYVRAKFFCTSDSISKLDPWGNHTRDCDAPPGVTGPCLAAMPRWTFKNGVCVKFMYGGCKGSNNRFTSLEECKRVCKVWIVKYNVWPNDFSYRQVISPKVDVFDLVILTNKSQKWLSVLIFIKLPKKWH